MRLSKRSIYPAGVLYRLFMSSILIVSSQLCNAQVVDGTGGVFSSFKTKILPIMNSLVGIACLFGIGKGVLDMMGGQEHGKRNLVWVVVGGLIWTAASYIISALS